MKKIILALLLLFFVSASDAAGKIRIGVVGFDSKADGVSQEQATIISDLFTRALAGSKNISVFERERLKKIGEEIKLNMSGLVDMDTAVEVGRIAGLQYMIMGSVTELTQNASGATIPIFGGINVGGGSHGGRATIDIRVVDVATSEIVLALSETGTAANTSSAVSLIGFSFVESQFGGLQARAIADAVQRLAHSVRGNLGGENSHVLSISTEGVIIDIGSTMGAKEGHLYLVYADGKSILDMDDKIIGRERLPLAVLKIKDVASSHSTCSVAPPSDSKMIRRGDKIEPVSAAKAKTLKFVTSRPPASSGTFDEVFGDGKTAANQDEITPTSIPGFDPNKSTDAKVIQTYGIDPGKANLLNIGHKNTMRLYNSGRYKDATAKFIEMFGEYNGHYLAAYWAGVSAQKLKKNDESLMWINTALSINPNYEPAINFKKKTLKK